MAEAHDAIPSWTSVTRGTSVFARCVTCGEVITKINKRTGKLSKWRHVDADEKNR